MNENEMDILYMYKKYHSGKENAITRAEFKLKHFHRFDFQPLDDRQFRQIYSNLPICTCAKGGFYPIRKSEIEEFREYMRKKAIPHFERFNRVRDAHPELAEDIAQLELFEEKIPGVMTFKEIMKEWERELNEHIQQAKDIARKEGKTVVIKDGDVRIENDR